MKTLKMKSILFSLLSMMAVAVFLTSCEQEIVEIIPSEDVDSYVIAEQDMIFENIETRSCAPSSNVVAQKLNTLILRIQQYNVSPTSTNKSRVKSAYQNYRNYLQSTLGNCGATVPQPYWGYGSCSTTSFPACPLYAVSALQRLQCDINSFLNNPSSCVAKQSLQIRFVDYIKTLNYCFNAGLTNLSGYANALKLPPCSGYYY